MKPVRTVIVSFILLLIVLPSPSFTQASSSLPEPDKDPFVGTWQANADKSRPKLNKAQATYVRTMSREGDDLVFASRVKRKHSAGFSENHYKIRCDGLPHRVPCGEFTCTTSCTYVAANRVEGDTKSPNGQSSSYWAREVSSDGQELRIYGYKDKGRKKLASLEVADRVK
jgi:hypothetical protein